MKALNSPAAYEVTLERLNSELRAAMQEGMASGPAISAADLFAELNERYAEPKHSLPNPSAKARGKHAR